MHSYISSSDNEHKKPDIHKGWICSIKTLLAGVLIFGSVVLIYNQLIGLFETAIGDGLNARALTMIDYLPNVTAVDTQKKTIMVFGSSMVQYGFLPPLFDQEMKRRGVESSTFNYGIANLNPIFQEYITRRIREEFEKHDKKLSLTLVELTPFQMTATRNRESSYTKDQNLAVLSDNRELWRHTLNDPATGVRLFEIRYLRKGYSAELISSLPNIVSQVTAYTESKGYDEAKQKVDTAEAVFRSNMANDNYPSSPLPGWNPLTRGGPLDTTLLSKKTLEALADYNHAIRHPVILKADLERRINTSDILKLEFDESSIDAFIRMIINLQAVSRKVEVFLMPRNTAWVDYTPEVQQRLDALKLRVTMETGAKVKDYQTIPELSEKYFRDTTHLNSEGTEIFTNILAEQYADSCNHDESF